MLSVSIETDCRRSEHATFPPARDALSGKQQNNTQVFFYNLTPNGSLGVNEDFLGQMLCHGRIGDTVLSGFYPSRKSIFHSG